VIEASSAASRASGLSTLRRRLRLRHPFEHAPLAGGVAEAHGDGTRLDAFHRVVERVREDEAPELAVGDDVEADVDLARHNLADLLLDDLGEC
jgi:hypothetical protein